MRHVAANVQTHPKVLTSHTVALVESRKEVSEGAMQYWVPGPCSSYFARRSFAFVVAVQEDENPANSCIVTDLLTDSQSAMTFQALESACREVVVSMQQD